MNKKDKVLISILLCLCLIFCLNIINLIIDFKADYKCYRLSDTDFYTSNICKPYWKYRKEIDKLKELKEGDK